MKIVFVESSTRMGGVQFSTLYLLQHLSSQQWNAVVVCAGDGDLNDACCRSNIALTNLCLPRVRSVSIRIKLTGTKIPNVMAWVWNIFAILVSSLRLARFLRKTKPDLVVTKGLFGHFYGGFTARCLGIPCIWHVQDFISEGFMKIYVRIFREFTRRLPNHIIVDGRAICRQLHPAVQNRVTIIHNGIDTTTYRPEIDGRPFRREMKIPLDAMVIGHVARMTPWKGQHYLLEAFAQVVAENPNAYLLFVGAPVFDNDNYQKFLLDQTAKLGLIDKVKFAGYRHDTPCAMAAMNVFAFTSTEKDTSPLALLSAMSSGLPIVAFEIEGVRELMSEQEFLAVPVKRVDLLADSLRKLLADPTLCTKLSNAARRRTVEEYSLLDHTNRMEQVFLKVLSASGVRVSQQSKVAACQVEN